MKKMLYLCTLLTLLLMNYRFLRYIHHFSLSVCLLGAVFCANSCTSFHEAHTTIAYVDSLDARGCFLQIPPHWTKLFPPSTTRSDVLLNAPHSLMPTTISGVSMTTVSIVSARLPIVTLPATNYRLTTISTAEEPIPVWHISVCASGLTTSH